METTTRSSYWKYVIPGILVLLVLWVFSGYNGLVTQKENVDNSWRQVETQYQRRIDLVGNLVNTVKGAANFEQSTFVAVTQARSGWDEAKASGDRTQEIQAANSFDSVFSGLHLTVEAYPQLQATQAFRDLMTQLEGTENRISVARMDYNDTVRDYNIRVKTFPGNIVAALFGYKPEPGFQAAAGSDIAPTVNFDQ